MGKNNKIRLLLIGPLPPPYAGPEIGTKLLVESELRYMVLLYHINTTTAKTNYEKGKFSFSLIYSFIVYNVQLLRYILFERVEVVLYLPLSLSSTGVFRDISTILLTKLLKRKLVVQFRGGHFKFAYQTLPVVLRHIVSILVKKVDLFLVQANRLKNQVKFLLPENKIKVLYNGVKPEDFVFHRCKKNEKVKILYIGHLSVPKGYTTLLKVVPEICKQYPFVEFYFAGTPIKNVARVLKNQVTESKIPVEDIDKIYKEFIKDQGLDGHCLYYLGSELKGEDKKKVFSCSDIFVLPSYSEGFSMAVLEAMAAGLAVVTTPVGANPEIIENGIDGILIHPGDVNKLREALCYLIENPEIREQMGKLAREKVLRNFTIDKLVKKLYSYVTYVSKM